MRITLNLATRPFENLGPAIKRLRIALAVLALVAIGLGLGLRAIHQKAEAARDRDHSLDGQIARVTFERQNYQDLMRQPDNAQLLTQVQALNRIFDDKGFSWTLSMEDLETLLPSGVQVATLEPERAKDGHITLHLRVIGPRDRTLELVRNLEHSRRFFLPRIVGENSETGGGPNEALEPVSASNRVDFDLLADYIPARHGEINAIGKPAPSREESDHKFVRVQHAGQPVGGPALHPRQKDLSAGIPLLGPQQQVSHPPFTGQSRPDRTAPKPNPSKKLTPGGAQ